MKQPIAQVEAVDGVHYVTLRIPNRYGVWRLSCILAAAATRQGYTVKEAATWRRAGAELKKYVEVYRDYPGASVRGRVRRPPPGPPNEFDMEQVLRGEMPFPVLSVKDVHTVYPLLEAKGLGARDIAERLWISYRTVVRWRAATRKRSGK